MGSPSATVLFLGYAMFAFELITDLTVLAIICLNLAVLIPTKILHTNLKTILITQTAALALSVLDRSAMLFKKFISNNPFMAPFMPLQSILTFATIFRRLLGHVLIIERTIATIFTNSYENFSKYVFTLAWFSLLFIIAFVDAITNDSWGTTPLMLFTSSFSTCLSFVEFLLIAIIGHYNTTKYSMQISKASVNNYDIERRFNVLYNVRSAKQLTPTFLLLFLSNLFMTLVYIVITFKMAKEQYQISLAYAIAIWIEVVNGAAIELTILTYHPLLKRRFVAILKRIFCFPRQRVQVVPDPAAAAEQFANVLKKGEEETKEHFKMLQELWK